METSKQNSQPTTSPSEYLKDKFTNFMTFLEELNPPSFKELNEKRKTMGLQIEQEMAIFFPNYLAMITCPSFIEAIIIWECSWSLASEGDGKYNTLQAFILLNQKDLVAVAEELQTTLPIGKYVPFAKIWTEICALVDPNKTPKENSENIDKVFRFVRYLALFNSIFFDTGKK
jgi:hypothetical protein